MRTAFAKPALGLAVLVSLTALPRATEGQIPFTPAATDCLWTITTAVPASISCSGAWLGNDNPLTDVLALIQAPPDPTPTGWGGFGLTNWTLDNYVGTGEVGGPSGPFQGQLPDANSGTLTLNRSYNGTFILFLKSSDAFSGYRIEADGLTEIQFATSGVAQNVRDIDQNLSHASVWAVVPEPSTMILLASGMLGLGLFGYRRRRLS